MYWQGWVLLIIVLFITATIIVCHKWLKKVTNYYFFWLAISLFGLIWLVVNRYAIDIKKYIDLLQTTFDPSTKENSAIISHALALDLCPFVAIILPISLIADPSRRVARSISLLGVLGGGIILAVQPFYNLVDFSAQYIFFGSPESYCSFFLHFFIFIVSIGVLLNTPSGGWKGFVLTAIIAGLFFCYVAIMMSCTGCKWFVTGLSLNDWKEGEYRMVSIVTGIPYYVCPAICYPLAVLAVFGLFMLKDHAFNRGWYTYGNAYSHKWYHWYNYNKFVKQKVL